MKEFELPSGAKLRLGLAPFEHARDLYQAILEESKTLKINFNDEMDVNFFKDIFCTFLSSKKIEEKIWKCLEKCLYNDLKVNKDTFEPEEARQDYIEVMFRVSLENITPFGKALFAQYAPLLAKLKEGLASK